MDPSSMPNLAGAFDVARTLPAALEWQYGGERTGEMVAELARSCVLGGLEAIHNYLAAGDEGSVALAGIVHAAHVAVDKGFIKIVTMDIGPEGENDASNKIVGLKAQTISDQNGLQMVCIYVTHSWVERALETGSNETNADVLTLLAGVALPAVSLIEPRFFSFSVSPPQPGTSESPEASKFDMGSNLPMDVVLGAGHLIETVLKGILKP